MTRREVLRGVAAAAAGVATRSMATDKTVVIGLQLYSLDAELTRDLAGTLARIAALGIRDVELAQSFGLSARDLRQHLRDAGLNAVSGHYNAQSLLDDADRQLAYAHELGLTYVVCPDLSHGDASGVAQFTSADWARNAEFFNRIGARVRDAGLRFAVHNHGDELRNVGATSGYDQLLKLTDPALVTMELDCGWVAVAGLDPVTYLTRYSDRYELLHLKDVDRASIGATTRPQFTEAGTGAVDWPRVLDAAKHARYAYIEMEAPFRIPALESVQASFGYFRKIESR
jgi:sugar phosphate isomerase/epimerase